MRQPRSERDVGRDVTLIASTRSILETSLTRRAKQNERDATCGSTRPATTGTIVTTQPHSIAGGYGRSPVVTIVSVMSLVSVVLILPIVRPNDWPQIPFIEETSVRGGRLRRATTGGLKTAKFW